MEHVSPVWNRWASPQRVISLIDGRWTLAVLAELVDGGRRYQELDDALDGVSHKVLTDTSDGLNVTAWLCVISTLVGSTRPPSTSSPISAGPSTSPSPPWGVGPRTTGPKWKWPGDAGANATSDHHNFVN